MTETNVPEQEIPSLGARIAATFTAPRRLARYLGAGAPWADALLVGTALAALAAAGQPGEVYLEQVEDPVTRRGEPVTITSAPADVIAWGRAMAALSALPGHPIIAFSLAGLLALLFGVLSSGRASYRQYLGLASHALIVYALGAALLLPVQWATGEAGVSVSPGALIPGWASAPSPVVRALASVDLFTVWTLVVLALGAAALNERRSWIGPLAALLGLYLALLGVTASLPS